MEVDVKPSNESLSMVNKCIESLEKLVNLKTSADRALYVASIERLQAVVCLEECALEHFVSAHTGGIPLLVAILEKCQDQSVRYFAIVIMEKILAYKSSEVDLVQAFVLLGAADHLLKLIVKCQLSWGEELICVLYKVTAKIADEDKKFAVKARFLGVLPVIVSHLKTYSKKCDVLNTILKLLKKIMTSSVNATKLCKDGLTKELLHFLDDSKKLTIILVLEAVSEATRSRHATRQFIKDDIVPRVLQLIFNTSTSCQSKFSVSIAKTCLKILVHLTQQKIGREKLLSANTVPSLLNWCEGWLDISGGQYNVLVSLVSTVVQRCLTPRPLPVRKLSNPVVFPLSESFCHPESDGSEGKNEDCLSLASSNFSSAESASDSEEETSPLDIMESSYHETIDQFSVFFHELWESHIPQHSQNSEFEEITFQDSIYNSFLSSPTIDLIDSKSVSPSEDYVGHFSNSSEHHCINEHLQHTETCMCDIPETMPSENIDKYCDKNSILPSDYDINNLFNSDNFFDSQNDDCTVQQYTDMYHKESASTISVIPFVKLAFPDTVNAIPYNGMEALFKPDPFLMRQKIFKNSEEMAHYDSFYREIYSLDTLINENHPNQSTLTNRDEQLICVEQQFEHLKFESRFESGNLRKVFWKGENEYDLILNPDINSKGHLQWFYFQISGMQANFPYTFNIINMEKSTSLFNEGMCPVMFSVKNYKENEEGWIRAGYDICYFRNHYVQGLSMNSFLRNKSYYTLTFSVIFKHSNDICYFAYHFPYTFTTLQTQLQFLENTVDSSSIYFKNDELCKTLSGNSVPLLTITSKPLDYKRPYVFLTARVHPGESNSSWVMKGALDFLLSNRAQRQREMYIFKIVPMLNPDGVINGSLRCSLSGQDLNRQWIVPSAYLHPTIYHTKSLFHYLASKNKKPLVFCDFHGHSRRSNAFFFGCNPSQSWWPNDKIKADSQSFKLLPIMLNEVAPTFSLEDCKFTIERSRESTGRVTIWRQFNVPLSYTLECSYGGCNQGKYSGYHISIVHLEDTGKSLCFCLGQLVLDCQYSLIKYPSSVNLESFDWPIVNRVLQSKYASSTETDEDFENGEDEDNAL